MKPEQPLKLEAQFEVDSKVFRVPRLGVQRFVAPQHLRFVVVGISNTVLGYLLFAALLAILGEGLYVLVGVLSHLVVSTASFWLNRAYVFGPGGRVFSDYAKFQVTSTGILVAYLVLLVALVEGLGLAALFAQIFCAGFVAFLGYLGHKFFTFRPLKKLR